MISDWQMTARGLALLILGGAISLTCSGCGGRFTPSRATVRAHQQAVLEDVRDDVDFVKHEQGNVSTEMRLIEGKLASQEAFLDSLRRELVDAQNASRQHQSAQLSHFEDRLAILERVQEGLVSDIRHLKTHANDVAESLTQAKKRLNDFEASIDKHQRDVQNLEGAVRALMAVVQGESKTGSSLAAQVRRYRVKPGDTLEKIARAHHTTIGELKKANNLKSDLIVIDQELLLPE